MSPISASSSVSACLDVVGQAPWFAVADVDILTTVYLTAQSNIRAARCLYKDKCSTPFSLSLSFRKTKYVFFLSVYFFSLAET